MSPDRSDSRAEGRLHTQSEVGVFMPGLEVIEESGVVALEGDLTLGRASLAEITGASVEMAATDPWKRFKYTPDECLGKLTSLVQNGGAVLSLRSEGQMVAFAAVDPAGFSGMPELAILCTLDGKRRLGYGSALLEAIEAEVFKVSNNLFLRVSDLGTRSVEFYERAGFSRIGDIPDYNFTGISEFIYRKTTGAKRDHLMD